MIEDYIYIKLLFRNKTQILYRESTDDIYLYIDVPCIPFRN